VLVLGVAACGGSHGVSVAPTVADTGLQARTFGALGSLVVDGAGQTVYVNAGERGGADACTGPCQAAWPLLSVTAATALPTVAGGVRASLLGTISRPGGQVVLTYGGYPLHVYVGDTVPGDANGQGIQQVWSGITVAGRPAT
jgi:predicted lipoprotein with Yx(FWY)xxD motif